MRKWILPALLTCPVALFAIVSCSTSHPSAIPAPLWARQQVPAWTAQDLDFFLHGSMSTEIVPENVLSAFIAIYPDLFPSPDLSNLGLVPDPAFGWPVGFSRGTPEHLGSASSVGINCAACHFAEVQSTSSHATVRVIGTTSHFDAEAFFNAVIGATFRTNTTPAMKRFLGVYLDQSDPEPNLLKRANRQEEFEAVWKSQFTRINGAIASDTLGEQGVDFDGYNEIPPQSLRLTGKLLDKGVDLASISIAMLKLFHNMRMALHVPDQPPTQVPPASGPGRNDAFGLLSLELFGVPQPYAPVKFGLVWNVSHRQWVHWDGNTRSPLARNLLAALGLGAPLIGHRAELDFALIQRQTNLSEQIAPPRYPFAMDASAAQRGAALYQASCLSCHGNSQDSALYAPDEIGTDPTRARAFTQAQADRFNGFLSILETPGYHPPAEPGLRSTQEYLAPNLAGVWARSPYLHNGSVRTMQELLSPASRRAVIFRRGSRAYDEAEMGYTDDGPYEFNTQAPGNSNSGHEYGTSLSPAQRHDLIEYLKSL